MWHLYLNWLQSLTGSWLAFSVVSLGGLLAVSALAYYAVERLERHLIRQGYWPSHFSFVSKFFLSVEAFLLSLALMFVPTVVTVPATIVPIIYGVARAGIIASAAAMVLKALDILVKGYLRRLELHKADNLRERRIATKVEYVEKIVDVLVIVVAMALFLMGFERFRRIGGSLLASAGLASLILGFAAQRSLANLIAGFQIAFTQPIRIGDAVLVENEWGEIEEINLTYVVVRIWDLRRLVLPITYFLEKPFQNWTRTSAALVGAVLLPLDYSVPVEVLRAELTRILQASPLWDGKTNVVQVIDATDRGVVVRALVSARNSGQTFDLRCEVREKLIHYLQRHYPHALPRLRLDAVVADPGPNLGTAASSRAAPQSGQA